MQDVKLSAICDSIITVSLPLRRRNTVSINSTVLRCAYITHRRPQSRVESARIQPTLPAHARAFVQILDALEHALLVEPAQMARSLSFAVPLPVVSASSLRVRYLYAYTRDTVCDTSDVC